MLSTGGTGSQDVAAALVRLPGRADTTLGNSDIITCLKIILLILKMATRIITSTAIYYKLTTYFNDNNSKIMKEIHGTQK